MTKIKAWEKVPKDTNKPEDGYYTRVGDTKWLIGVYEYGYTLSIDGGRLKSGYINPKMTQYHRTLSALIVAIARIGPLIDGKVVKGLDEALEGTKKAVRFSVQVADKLEGFSHAA